MKALLSVYHKTGIDDFARQLITLGYEIISSGGTAKFLSEKGIGVTDVAEITGLSAVLGHRVVTLHPAIHGGLLATEGQREELEKLGWPWIDLVCVDLYPLDKVVNDPQATEEQIIELTDIGGPTIIRSAAKGQRIVVVDPADRQKVIDWHEAGMPDKNDFITKLAAKAEGIVANYCLLSARFYSKGGIDGFIGTEMAVCKYGENPWQKPAGLYGVSYDDPLAIHQFQQVEGTEPSFINFTDVDRVLQTTTHIAAGMETNLNQVPFIAVAVKHGNPCGAAIDWSNPLEALKKMVDGDRQSIFGGVVMTNFPIGKEEADILRHYGLKEGEKARMLDTVLAPSFSSEAAEILARKKTGKCRMFVNEALQRLGMESLDHSLRLRPVRGGFLAQPNYDFILRLNDERIQVHSYSGKLDSDDWPDIILAWAVCSTSNSNTITLVRNKMLLGNGVGQTDRVRAAKLAIQRATENGHRTEGAIAFSDSFFPFPDGVEVLISAQVGIIFAFSGSQNDSKVIELCQTLAKVPLVLIPVEVGRGFCWH